LIRKCHFSPFPGQRCPNAPVLQGPPLCLDLLGPLLGQVALLDQLVEILGRDVDELLVAEANVLSEVDPPSGLKELYSKPPAGISLARSWDRFFYLMSLLISLVWMRMSFLDRFFLLMRMLSSLAVIKVSFSSQRPINVLSDMKTKKDILFYYRATAGLHS
jgi:hypothetical protein